MEDHRDALKLKIGSVPAPGEVGGSKLEGKELDLGIFGESWKVLRGNLQSANTIPPPYIEILSSWSAERNKRKFIRKMDTTYHSICRLRDVREEKQQSMVYTEYTDSSRHCHLPPPASHFPSVGEHWKRDEMGTIPKVLEGKETEIKLDLKLGGNFTKGIAKKKAEGKEKEKGGDKKNLKPKIYKMGRIGEFLQRKSLLKERPVQKEFKKFKKFNYCKLWSRGK